MSEALKKYETALNALKELVAAEKASLKACENMRKAEPGTSRAKSTTISARWSTAAEHRDRTAHQAHVAVVRAGLAERFDDSYYGEFPSGHKWGQILITKERP